MRRIKKKQFDQNEDYLDYNNNEGADNIEEIPNKQLEASSLSMFEDVRYERSLILISSISDPE